MGGIEVISYHSVSALGSSTGTSTGMFMSIGFILTIVLCCEKRMFWQWIFCQIQCFSQL